jgi:hypothetical protein
MKKITSFALFVAALALYSLAFAVDQQPAAKPEHVMFTGSDLKWGDAPPSLPAGAKLAVLSGDPGKPGMFAIRLQMPAGYKIPAHTHPAKEAPAGAFVVMPAGMQHFAGSKAGCIVQVQSTGPFQVTYVNPADDPRGAKK